MPWLDVLRRWKCDSRTGGQAIGRQEASVNADTASCATWADSSSLLGSGCSILAPNRPNGPADQCSQLGVERTQFGCSFWAVRNHHVIRWCVRRLSAQHLLSPARHRRAITVIHPETFLASEHSLVAYRKK